MSLQTFPIECDGEKAAAEVLGFNQVTWDDESGTERLPLPARLPWISLTFIEKKAVKLLGFKKNTWDYKSSSTLPAAFYKTWAELDECREFILRYNINMQLATTY